MYSTAHGHQILRATLLLAAAGTLASCQQKGKAAAEQGAPVAVSAGPAVPATPRPTAAQVDKAKKTFLMRCTPCHGMEGKGDGPASLALTPKPRNFHDPTWNVTDEHIKKIVQYGGAAVGKSPTMPGNPDLSEDGVLEAFKDIIRSFHGK